MGYLRRDPAWLDCGEEATRIKEMRRKRDGGRLRQSSLDHYQMLVSESGSDKRVLHHKFCDETGDHVPTADVEPIKRLLL